MAQIIISQLPPAPNGTGSGSPKGTDLTPATDTTDLTEAATGTTKKYTRSAELNFYLSSQGLTTYSAVLGATTAALTVVYANGVLGVGATLTNAGAQAAFTVDGVTFVVGDRVLVKNQVSTFQNGIYTVTTLGTASTNWVLTRATDYDQAAEVIQYGVVLSNQGTLNAGKLWQETGAGPWTMGTTAIIFSAYLAGSGSSVNAGLINEVAYYAASGSTVSGLTTANNGILSTSAAGVPAINTTVDLVGQFNVDNLRLDGNTITSTNANGNINLIPNGTGVVSLFNSSSALVSGVNFQVAKASSAGNILFGTYVNSSSGSNIYGAKSRNTTPGSFTIVQNGDELLNIYSLGDDGTALISGALIRTKVSGTPSAGVMPTLMEFYTKNTTGTLTLGMTLSNAQVLMANNLHADMATTATAAGTTTLTVASKGIQEFTGVTTQTVTLPVTSTLGVGHQFYIINNSTGAVTVNSSGGNAVQVLSANTSVLLTVVLASGTTAASWQSAYLTDAGVATPGSAGTILRSNGTNWLASTSTFADTYGASTLLYSNGANTVTGLATANNGLLVTSAAGVPSILAGPGTTGNLLQSNAAAAPSYSTSTYPSTNAINTLLYASSANVMAALATANSAVLTTGATGVPVMTALATDGQVIVGSTAGAPAAATLTPGTGISIANGANSITISATGGGFGVATISGTSQAAAVNTMYIALNAGQTTLTLPGTCSVGDSVILVGSTANTGGWVVTAAAGDTIIYNGATTGGARSLTSSALAGQTIEMVCDVADTSWVVVDTVNTTLTTS